MGPIVELSEPMRFHLVEMMRATEGARLARYLWQHHAEATLMDRAAHHFQIAARMALPMAISRLAQEPLTSKGFSDRIAGVRPW